MPRSSGPKVGTQDWFDEHQGFLLWLSNTRAGRDMLCIRRDVPQNHSVVRLRPHGFDTVLRGPRENFHHALWGLREAAREGRPVEIRADFRCRPRIANRLCHSWVRNVPAWNRYLVDTWDHVGSPFRMRPAFAASPLTVYSEPWGGGNSCDGETSRSVTNEAWATIIAGAGSTSSDALNSVHIVYIGSGTTAWNVVTRGLFGYLTSTIGETSTINTGTISLYGNSKSDNLVATPNVNIYGATPASNTAVAAGDFVLTQSTAFSTAITYAAFNAAAYNDFVLNASGIAAISKTGVSNFSGKNANYDVGATEPPYIASQISLLRVYGADFFGTTSDPKLVVTYTAAVTWIPKAIAA